MEDTIVDWRDLEWPRQNGAPECKYRYGYSWQQMEGSHQSWLRQLAGGGEESDSSADTDKKLCVDDGYEADVEDN